MGFYFVVRCEFNIVVFIVEAKYILMMICNGEFFEFKFEVEILKYLRFKKFTEFSLINRRMR